MEWNNGTVFRVYINSGEGVKVNTKVDISQQELSGKCHIGVENYVLKPRVGIVNPIDPVTSAPYVLSPEQLAIVATMQDYWSRTTYLQLESFQLNPYIDFSSHNNGTSEENNNRSRNTTIFARLPLIAVPTLGNSLLTVEATFGSDRVLNKDSILYEMRNNPHALSNGRLNYRILNQNGDAVPNPISYEGLEDPLNPGEFLVPPTSYPYINAFSFTLVIYKQSDYN